LRISRFEVALQSGVHEQFTVEKISLNVSGSVGGFSPTREFTKLLLENRGRKVICHVPVLNESDLISLYYYFDFCCFFKRSIAHFVCSVSDTTFGRCTPVDARIA
jgi:hypothetical protein